MQSTLCVRTEATMPTQMPFDLTFSSREVTACDGLWSSCKRPLKSRCFQKTLQSWDLP